MSAQTRTQQPANSQFQGRSVPVPDQELQILLNALAAKVSHATGLRPDTPITIFNVHTNNNVVVLTPKDLSPRSTKAVTHNSAVVEVEASKAKEAPEEEITLVKSTAHSSRHSSERGSKRSTPRSSGRSTPRSRTHTRSKQSSTQTSTAQPSKQNSSEHSNSNANANGSSSRHSSAAPSHEQRTQHKKEKQQQRRVRPRSSSAFMHKERASASVSSASGNARRRSGSLNLSAMKRNSAGTGGAADTKDSANLTMSSQKYVYSYRKPGAVFGGAARPCNVVQRASTPAVGEYAPKVMEKAGGEFSRLKRFQKQRSSLGSIYHPNYSFVKKRASGGSFGRSSRFVAKPTAFDKRTRTSVRKTRKASAATTTADDIIDRLNNGEDVSGLEDKMSDGNGDDAAAAEVNQEDAVKFNGVSINKSHIDTRDYTPSSVAVHKKVTGGRFSDCKRFKAPRRTSLGPGCYENPHHLNHSRLPFHLYKRPSSSRKK